MPELELGAGSPDDVGEIMGAGDDGVAGDPGASDELMPASSTLCSTIAPPGPAGSELAASCVDEGGWLDPGAAACPSPASQVHPGALVVLP